MKGFLEVVLEASCCLTQASFKMPTQFGPMIAVHSALHGALQTQDDKSKATTQQLKGKKKQNKF